jgi:hypothetical protein
MAPAASQAQQRLMGMVHAYQKGELKSPSGKVKDVAKHILKSDAKDFASTKSKGLPEKKEASIKERILVAMVKTAFARQ